MQSLLQTPMLRLKGLLTTNTPRHSRVWVLAVVLLAAATIGANSWFLYFRDRTPTGELTNSIPEEPPVGVDNVVCFGHVDVEYGVRSLYPLQPGRVAQVLAHDGEKVKANAELLRIDDRQAKHQLQEAEADLKAAHARLESAKLALKRKQKLLESKNTPKEDVDIAAELVAEAEAGVAAKQAQRDRAERALQECSLRAPTDGEVLRVLVGPGDVLGPQPRQPAVLFCPNLARLIRAEVSQEFASRVRVGQPASIQDDTNPTSETWHGKVIRVSNWYTNRRSIMQEPLQVNDVRTLECIIGVDDPHASSLRIGQRMRLVIGTPH